MTIVARWPEIADVLPGLDLIAAVAQGFVAYSLGKATVPPVGELLFPRGEAHIKFGFIDGDSTFAIKVATGFYDNPAQGLSSSNGLITVCDSKTGAPLAVLLDEGHLTNIRTALAGTIAAKYLAPKRVEGIGVIGTGIQARLQARHLRAVTQCRKVYVYGRRREAVEAYCGEMTLSGFEVIACETPSAVAKRANLIVTTTPAYEPLLMSDDIREGTHITAVGADTAAKNEIDPVLFSRAARVVADSRSQCLERGEIHHAIARGTVTGEQIVELGAIINGDAPGRQRDSEITIADLTGVAVQDIKVAQAVYAAIKTRRAAA